MVGPESGWGAVGTQGLSPPLSRLPRCAAAAARERALAIPAPTLPPPTPARTPSSELRPSQSRPLRSCWQSSPGAAVAATFRGRFLLRGLRQAAESGRLLGTARHRDRCRVPAGDPTAAAAAMPTMRRTVSEIRSRAEGEWLQHRGV